VSYGNVQSAARAVVVGLGLGFLLLSGCSSQSYEGPKRFEMSGTVTFDGKPITEGTISLIPAGGRGSRRVAATIENGAYSIPEESGPNLGKYSVEICAYEPVGPPGAAINEDMSVPTKQVLPAKFNDKTTLEVEIVDGENVHDFTLTP